MLVRAQKKTEQIRHINQKQQKNMKKKQKNTKNNTTSHNQFEN